MKRAVWHRQLAEERPSPALARSFGTSAAALLPTLSETSLQTLKDLYLDPRRLLEPPPEVIASHLAGAALLWDRDAAEGLLMVAAGVHMEPFRAISAQVFQQEGEPEDYARMRSLLLALVTDAGFAEAAVLLALSENELATPPETDWLVVAESIWPPAVAEISRSHSRVMWFGSYYVALLLAIGQGGE